MERYKRTAQGRVQAEGSFTPRKNSDIEVLRAFAILFTMFLHFRTLLPPGSPILAPLAFLNLSVGVDLFLVISGYVITGSLMESRHNRTTPPSLIAQKQPTV